MGRSYEQWTGASGEPTESMASRLSTTWGWLAAVLLALLVPQWSGAMGAPWPAEAASAAVELSPVAASDAAGSRHSSAREPGLTIEPFVRPDLARRMERLRPAILAAAARHNQPAHSGMSDRQFAATIAVVIYNENFGWLEDDIAPLRAFTPLYQGLQRGANTYVPGSDFSVWPANLRPSVALEILHQQLPLADTSVVSVPVTVRGSRIEPASYASREELFAAITAEISRDDMAVAYLAANLERGVYRAAHDGAPVSWRTLAAWHNQGIVDPRAIRANPTASDYVRRASAFLPLARALVAPHRPQLPQVEMR
jgi:hypothetical protein